jgi:ubiquinone/menaquinone biosynthesis C-methylase UbiE
MRRQALVPLRAALAELAPSRRNTARLLDLACGTGSFLREVKVNWPRLHVTGLDLSPHYLAVARRALAAWSRTRFQEGAAEAMPFADGEFDIVTCIYLFHELPPRVRRAVVAEMSRVLRPGGAVILVDSLQLGDEPDYDAMLDSFPIGFHEPFYASYIREDLDRLMSPGFTPAGRFPAYFSKVLSYRRVPDAARPPESIS